MRVPRGATSSRSSTRSACASNHSSRRACRAFGLVESRRHVHVGAVKGVECGASTIRCRDRLVLVDYRGAAGRPSPPRPFGAARSMLVDGYGSTRWCGVLRSICCAHVGGCLSDEVVELSASGGELRERRRRRAFGRRRRDRERRRRPCGRCAAGRVLAATSAIPTGCDSGAAWVSSSLSWLGLVAVDDVDAGAVGGLG